MRARAAQAIAVLCLASLGLYASLRVKGDIAEFILKDTKTPFKSKTQPSDTLGQNLLQT